MRVSPRGLRAAVTYLAAIIALSGVALACPSCADPLAGSAGLGDPYLPSAGNGGYEVSHYQVTLTVDPVADTLAGTTTVQARATQELASFHLDLRGLEVKSVSLDGKAAKFRRKGSELAIVCPSTLNSGQDFAVEVSYAGTPKPVKDSGSFSLGWQDQDGYIFTLDEPSGADSWFPSNDHPSDKATYEFRITVPKPGVAAANGVLVATEDQGSDQTFVWEMRQPLATYLAQVTVGDYVVQTGTSPKGVALRNYFAPALADRAAAVFARTGDIIDYYAGLFGPYPFDAYGVVVPPVQTGAAMENQTLSLFGEDMLEKRMFDPTSAMVYLAHELAHQWYGDSVTVGRWEDIWLNEGFAEYASWLWLEHDQGRQALQSKVDQSIAKLTGESYPPLGNPGLDGMFSTNVYERGALTLHALRLTMGDKVFFGILRDWASKYRYGNATTDDFIALVRADAPAISADRLTGLLQSWLFGRKLPSLPGPSS